MLRSLKINRFKSILEADIEFGAVNLFVGQNGSGKSNLLEAIGMVSAAASRGMSDADLTAKGVRLSTPSMFKSAFKNRDLPVSLSLAATFDDEVDYRFSLRAGENDTHLRFANERAAVKGKAAFARTPNGSSLDQRQLRNRDIDPYRSLFDQLKISQDLPEELVRRMSEIAHYAIYSPQTEFLRGTQVGTVQRPPIGLHGEGLPIAARSLIQYCTELEYTNPDLFDVLNDILSTIWETGWVDRFNAGAIDPRLRSNQISTGEDTLFFRDKFMHSKRNHVTAYDSSEGVLFLLCIVILLAHPESPKIFALDNVDSGLNPRMTSTVVGKIVSTITDHAPAALGVGPRQVFVTSHNPTSLDPIDLFDERQRVFVVRRSDQGYTEFERIKPPQGMSRAEWIEAKAGRSLSELWISGMIPGALGEPM